MEDHLAAIRNVLPTIRPLSLNTLLYVAHLAREFSIDAFSGLMAAQQAIEGFKQLSSSASRTIIFTANALNEIMIQQGLTFGMAKRVVSYIVDAAVMAYREAGFGYVKRQNRFF